VNTANATAKEPRWVILVDVLIAVALAWGIAIWLLGPLPEVARGGFRLTSSSPGRALGIGIILLLVRARLAGAPRWLTRQLAALKQITADGEAALFGSASRAPFSEFALVVVGYAALVALATWPQVLDLYGVPDFGDPLFNAWRLAWIAHQLPTDPAHLFDANIFHPERLTFTYSDAMLVPAIVAAPFLWLGAAVMPTTTAMFLAGWVSSGVATYYLVRALTGRREAAIVAGAIFAIYPYRSEHYSHFELQFALWVPLTCWTLQRTLARGRWQDGALTGLCLGLQFLSSLYYGLFLSLYLVPLALTLWSFRGRPTRPIVALATGAVVTGLLVGPVALAYAANASAFGERPSYAVDFYSALPRDYLNPHMYSALYGQWASTSTPERNLFPGLIALALLAIALRRPWTRAKLGYALAGLIALDGSFGWHGVFYRLLYEWVGPFRGLRVPARFSLFVGFSIAVLVGYLVAKWVDRWPKHRWLIATGLVAALFIDMRPNLELTQAWRQPPAIYSAMAVSPKGVLAEFPVGLDAEHIPFDFSYTHFSIAHWHPLLNGASGFIPPSWEAFETATRTFPSDEALGYLRSRGVEFIAVHGGLYPDPEAFRWTQTTLLARSDVVRLATARFAGGTSELYRFRPPAP
jgi:hypothetical protein